MNPPKRGSDYWMRHGTQEELFEHLQHLVMKDVLSGQRISNFSTDPSLTPSTPRRSLSDPLEDPNFPMRLQPQEPVMEEGMNRDTAFQNLMPIINSSTSQSHYLSLMFSFITDNLTDLSAITNILDISKFVQQKRTPLVEEFNMDTNLKEVVSRLSRFREELKNGDNEERLEEIGRDSQARRQANGDKFIAEVGEKGVYTLVKPEYFRDHFETDLKTILQDKQGLEARIKELEKTRAAVENSRLIELTDKFDVFLEMMAKMGQIDAIMKKQVEIIGALR